MEREEGEIVSEEESGDEKEEEEEGKRGNIRKVPSAALKRLVMSTLGIRMLRPSDPGYISNPNERKKKDAKGNPIMIPTATYNSRIEREAKERQRNIEVLLHELDEKKRLQQEAEEKARLDDIQKREVARQKRHAERRIQEIKERAEAEQLKNEKNRQARRSHFIAKNIPRLLGSLKLAQDYNQSLSSLLSSSLSLTPSVKIPLTKAASSTLSHSNRVSGFSSLKPDETGEGLGWLTTKHVNHATRAPCIESLYTMGTVIHRSPTTTITMASQRENKDGKNGKNGNDKSGPFAIKEYKMNDPEWANGAARDIWFCQRLHMQSRGVAVHVTDVVVCEPDGREYMVMEKWTGNLKKLLRDQALELGYDRVQMYGEHKAAESTTVIALLTKWLSKSNKDRLHSKKTCATVSCIHYSQVVSLLRMMDSLNRSRIVHGHFSLHHVLHQVEDADKRPRVSPLRVPEASHRQTLPYPPSHSSLFTCCGFSHAGDMTSTSTEFPWAIQFTPPAPVSIVRGRESKPFQREYETHINRHQLNMALLPRMESAVEFSCILVFGVPGQEGPMLYAGAKANGTSDTERKVAKRLLTDEQRKNMQYDVDYVTTRFAEPAGLPLFYLPTTADIFLLSSSSSTLSNTLPPEEEEDKQEDESKSDKEEEEEEEEEEDEEEEEEDEKEEKEEKEEEDEKQEKKKKKNRGKTELQVQDMVGLVDSLWETLHYMKLAMEQQSIYKDTFRNIFKVCDDVVERRDRVRTWVKSLKDHATPEIRQILRSMDVLWIRNRTLCQVARRRWKELLDNDM